MPALTITRERAAALQQNWGSSPPPPPPPPTAAQGWGTWGRGQPKPPPIDKAAALPPPAPPVQSIAPPVSPPVSAPAPDYTAIQPSGQSAFDYQQRRTAAIPEGYTALRYVQGGTNLTDPSLPVWAPGERYHMKYAQYNITRDNPTGTRVISWGDEPQVAPPWEPQGYIDPYAPPPTAEEGWYNLPGWAIDKGRTQTYSPLLPGFDFSSLPTPEEQVTPLPEYLGDDQRYAPGPQEGVVAQTGTEGALPVYGSINDLPGEYMQGSNGTYLVINQPAELRLANGAAVYFTGAGTEIIGSDGMPYEWSESYQRYLPMRQGVNTSLWGDVGQSSFITDISQFHRLPQEIQQAIRSGEQTPFQLAPEVIAMVRQGISYQSTGEQMPDPNLAPSGIRGYLEYGFPTVMTDSYTDPASGIGMTDIYGYNRGFGFDIPQGQIFETGLYSLPNTVSDPWAPEDAEYVRSVWAEAEAARSSGLTPEEYWTGKELKTQQEYEAEIERLFGVNYADLLEPTSYDDLFDPAREARLSGGGLPGSKGYIPPGAGPQDGVDPAVGVEAQPPATGQDLLPPEQQASQDLIDTVTEPAGTVDEDFSVLTYGGETYQDLPSLLFAQGFISEAEYNTLADASTEIPGLELTLPPPNSLNFTRLEMIRTTDPSAWGMLESLWKAANRDLATEYYVARLRAPLGSAVQTTLIRT